MEKGKIFIVDESEDKLTEMNEELFAEEIHLQELIAKYPDLLAGDQIDPDRPKKWLLISREVQIPDIFSIGTTRRFPGPPIPVRFRTTPGSTMATSLETSIRTSATSTSVSSPPIHSQRRRRLWALTTARSSGHW